MVTFKDTGGRQLVATLPATIDIYKTRGRSYVLEFTYKDLHLKQIRIRPENIQDWEDELDCSFSSL